jgi:hypothetical protein
VRLRFGIPKSRGALIRRLAKRRILASRNPVTSSHGVFSPKQFLKGLEALDDAALEAYPEATIAWIVEQFLVLMRNGHPGEISIYIIQDFRAKELGIESDISLDGSNPTLMLRDFVKSRIDVEFPLLEPVTLVFVDWAVEQCIYYFGKRGVVQLPLA